MADEAGNVVLAALVSVSGKVIPKEGNVWNGYADAAAYAWGSDRMSEFLSQSRWIGPCFIEGDAANVLRRTMDAFRAEGLPDASDWTRLLSMSQRSCWPSRAMSIELESR